LKKKLIFGFLIVECPPQRIPLVKLEIKPS